MIFKDRVRREPYKRKITFQDGRVENVKIEEADGNVVEGGTPLNEINLNANYTFKTGETYKMDFVYTNGFITAGQSGLRTTIFLPKVITNAKPKSIKGSLWLRKCTGGYIDIPDYAHPLLLENLKITFQTTQNSNCLSMLISKADGGTFNVENNSAISFEMNNVIINF